MKILVCVPLTMNQLARLREKSGCDIAYHPEAGEAARPALHSCEVLFGNPPSTWLTESKNLRWVQLESVGFGEYLSLDWEKLGRKLKMSNLKGFFAEPVAQSIVAGILAHYRGIATLARLQQDTTWVGDSFRPNLRILADAELVMFGKGAINRRVAELLAPFNCRVTWIGRDRTRGELDKALSSADIAICAVPHTPETEGLLDRTLISGMKRSALLANFGRGSLIDEDALADALEAGELGGAVIDVTREEPLPPGHRFWRCPNMILTQHTGGGTANEIDQKIEFFLANLERYRRGEAPEGLVDPARGY